PPPDLGTTNWPCTAPNGPPKAEPKPPGRPWWGKAGRADGEGVATVPPGEAAAAPDAGEPDVAAIATPAPPSRATTATPARTSGRPGSLRVPSMSGRLPSRRRRGHRVDGSKAMLSSRLGLWLKRC